MNSSFLYRFRLVLITLLPILAFVWLTVLLTQDKKSVTPLDLKVPLLKCSSPPIYKIGYSRESNGVTSVKNGFDFQGLAWIETQVCSAGILTVVGSGQTAKGIAPILRIDLNTQTLADESFTSEHTLHLWIPGPGRLKLGYYNDYYSAVVREARFSNIAVSGCKSPPAVELSEGTQGQTILNSQVPFTILPCAAGKLSFDVVGFPAVGEFPKIMISQRKKILLRSESTSKTQSLQVDVEADPIAVTMTNFYGKVIDDRNLYIKRIQFQSK